MDLDDFNIIGRDSEIGRRAMSDSEAPWKSSAGMASSSMSASEKLKALGADKDYDGENHLSLFAALPQIVAVVEAAGTSLHEYELWSEDANDGEFAIWSRDDFMASFITLRAALTALKEALS